MNLVGTTSFFLLTICITSYGLTGAVYAQSQETPLSVETDYENYADGNKIFISGKVRDSSLAKNETPVTIRILNPDGNIVTIAQLDLNSNNEYSHSLRTGGPLWASSGDYKILAQYGAQKGETIFTYSSGTPHGSSPVVEEPVVVEVPKVEEPVIEEIVVVEEPVVIQEPEPEPEPEPMCGQGTVLEDGKCVAEERGGGCLIATAAFGSEMAPQVQFLRELRDNTVLQTQSGVSFMTGFNQFYYSFSPAIADYERENPVFKEAVKVTLTPLLTSLTLLNYVDIDTEEEMLGYGIGVILLNIGMYFVAPAAVIIAIKNRRK